MLMFDAMLVCVDGWHRVPWERGYLGYIVSFGRGLAAEDSQPPSSQLHPGV